MKKLLTLILAGVAFVGIINATNTKQQKSEKMLSDTSIGLRHTPLTDEKDTEIKNYTFGSGEPGESKKIDRSYENAPPLIPHSIEGLTPITRDNNACLGCHSPEYAKDMGATPLPKSHFYDLRTHQEMTGKIAEQRFNCTQCHVPQAQTKPLVKNNFKPDYRNPNSKHHSNLLDVINQGVQ